MAFIRRVIGEILDDLEGTEEISVKTPARSGEGEPGRANGTPASPPFEVAGVAASGTSDALTLRMLGQLLAPSKCTLVNIEDAGSPMQLADRVAEVSPAMVILSHLPPEALAQARYQVRRLRARFAGLPILVGRWGEAGSDAASAGALRSRGHARGLHAGRCPRPDPGQGRFRGSGDGCCGGGRRWRLRRRGVEPTGDSRRSVSHDHSVGAIISPGAGRSGSRPRSPDPFRPRR